MGTSGSDTGTFFEKEMVPGVSAGYHPDTKPMRL